jgi:putative endonuclease
MHAHAQNTAKGARGETIACSYLETKGYAILDRNFRTRFGEIDIIALHPQNKISFIEVKCKQGDKYGQPYEAVTEAKMMKLQKTITAYVLTHRLSKFKHAFEVVSITLKPDQTVEKILHFDSVSVS